MVRIRLQPHGSAAYESRVQSQKQNIRKHALLYFQPEKKGLIAREEGDRASCLKDVLKTPFFLEFASNGVANRDNNHMLLEHYYTSASSPPGKWCCSTTTSFHFVPTLERTTREPALSGMSSLLVRQRGILYGWSIVILRCPRAAIAFFGAFALALCFLMFELPRNDQGGSDGQ